MKNPFIEKDIRKSSMLLNQSLQNRNNGLTQARLVLALFVLFDHTYAINGLHRPNIFNLPISLSELAVWLFIFLSGLLCYRSAEKHTTHRYLVLRFFRLMPGYWICLLLTGLIVMPAFKFLELAGNTSWIDLPFSIIHFWEKNLLLTQGEFAPSGWLETLPVQAINGSLWTLQPELMGYIVILLVTPILSKSKLIAAISFATLDIATTFQPNITRRLLDHLFSGYGFELGNVSYLKLAVFLLSGIVFYRFSNSIPMRRSWAASATLILILSTFVHYKLFSLILPILLPYSFIVFCSKVHWPWKAENSDLSYGLYLYSFPIQQLIFASGRHAGWNFSLPLQIFLAAAMVMPFAWMSWHLIEKPSLIWISNLSLGRKG